jgi:hypothetical protein
LLSSLNRSKPGLAWRRQASLPRSKENRSRATTPVLDTKTHHVMRWWALATASPRVSETWLFTGASYGLLHCCELAGRPAILRQRER